MADKILMKGNEAIAEAAILAGVRHYFGYPITPQSELIEHMAKRLQKMDDGCFIQSESEIAAINMIYGASGSGARVLTSSSSPGVALKQEGISYCAGAELPFLVINVMRGGPGLGDIQPAQAEYFQAVKGGGNGDYKNIVVAPSTIQEAIELVFKAYELSDKYRNPSVMLLDGVLGQMMEPVELPKAIDPKSLPVKEWAMMGTQKKRQPNQINSLDIDPAKLEERNLRLQAKYKKMRENEVMVEMYKTDQDCDAYMAAFGTTARICKSVIDLAEQEGLKIGLIRPITLYPFPVEQVKEIASKGKPILTVELNAGQMVEDVRLAVNGKCETPFFGRMGGMVPTDNEIFNELKKYIKK
jgi:2-oxoglutarate ferredoxin oxidoreductase subunit alpha